MNSGNIVDTIQDSFLDLVDGAVDYVPNILAALALFVIGLILAGVISTLVGRLVTAIEKNKTVLSTAKRFNLKIIGVSDITALVTRWAILLIFINAAVDALGVTVLTDTFDKIIGFLPNIFAAVLIAAVSLIIGNVVKDIVQESAKKARIKANGFLGSASRVAILVFGLPLAAAQLGLDLTILNNNITVIVAGVMLAFGIAFGFGGKETAAKIVDDVYKNWKK